MLEAVKSKILDFVKEFNSKEIEEVFSKISQGKMLRSKLIFKISRANDKATLLSSIVEMIHLASLLHDDVIDEADSRRGKPSINNLYSDKTSIMLGDILYSKAFFELTKFEPKIAQIISNSVTLLSIGEFLDVELSKKFNTDRDAYFDMIYKKTASLIEASSKASAILANKDENKFALYGKNLGLAFQIVDDILDITQSSEKLGKPAMNDFKEGKTTLPYIYLYENSNSDDREKILSLFGKELNEVDTIWLKERLHSSGAIEYSLKIVKELAKDAIDAVEGESDLISIIEDMVNRDF